MPESQRLAAAAGKKAQLLRGAAGRHGVPSSSRTKKKARRIEDAPTNKNVWQLLCWTFIVAKTPPLRTVATPWAASVRAGDLATSPQLFHKAGFSRRNEGTRSKRPGQPMHEGHRRRGLYRNRAPSPSASGRGDGRAENLSTAAPATASRQSGRGPFPERKTRPLAGLGPRAAAGRLSGSVGSRRTGPIRRGAPAGSPAGCGRAGRPGIRTAARR